MEIENSDCKKPLENPIINFRKRYELVPHIKYYDDMRIAWVPFLMHFHESNYRSDVVNTDFQGFRRTFITSELPIILGQPEERPCSLWLGNSVAFGVGTTHDRKTVPSLLNSWGADELWVNFAGRSFLSMQEFILFTIYHQQFQNIKKVIIFSGLNDLVTYFIRSDYYQDFGNFSYIGKYQKFMGHLSAFDSWVFPNLKQKAASFYKKISEHELEKEALMVVMRQNIRNWKLYADALGFELIYILQPLAFCLNKSLSPEEQLLFRIIEENAQDKFWKSLLLGKVGLDKYIWFKDKLKEICESVEIRFHDINEHLATKQLDGKWLFIDPGHLTDYGTEICADIIKNEILG